MFAQFATLDLPEDLSAAIYYKYVQHTFSRYIVNNAFRYDGFYYYSQQEVLRFLNKKLEITTLSLEYASEGGNDDMVRFLIDSSCKVTESSIKKAIMNHCYSTVQLLISNIDKIPEDILFHAIRYYRDGSMIELLVDLGVKITGRDIIGAVIDGNNDAIRLLFKLQSDDIHPDRLMNFAVEFDHPYTVNLLLEYGVKIYKDDFQTAVDQGYTEIVDSFVKARGLAKPYDC